MKKFIILLMLGAMLVPKQAKAQNAGGAAAGAIAGLVVAGALTAAAIEAAKEGAEQYAMEYVLAERPDLTFFELKTSSFTGLKAKDQSSVRIVLFEITDFKTSERLVLFGFSETGFANQNGIDYRKVDWKMYKATEWNKMMAAYIELASGKSISEMDLKTIKIVNNGVKKDGDFIVEFSKLRGDVYKVLDYSDEFKIVFNERSLGLFLKKLGEVEEGDLAYSYKSSLVQIRRRTIIRTHAFLNGYAVNDGGKRKGRK